MASGSEHNLRGKLHLDEMPFSKMKPCCFFFHKIQRTSKFVCGKINHRNDILSKAYLRIHTATEEEKLGVWVPDSLPEKDLSISLCGANS